MSSVLFRNVVCAALLVSSIALFGFACSNGDADAKPNGGVPDATLETDGGDGDASVADHDASEAPDAQPRTCSDDNVCQTVLPPNSFLRDVWSAGDGVVWAVGWKEPPNSDLTGTILRWDGSAWAVQFETAGQVLSALWGSSPTDIWAGGEGGLYHGTGPSSDAITWTKVRSELVTSIRGYERERRLGGRVDAGFAVLLRRQGPPLSRHERRRWRRLGDSIPSHRRARRRTARSGARARMTSGLAEPNASSPPLTEPRMLTIRGRGKGDGGDGGLAWSDVVPAVARPSSAGASSPVAE